MPETTFVAQGPIASSASTASLAVTAPVVQAGDTLFCAGFCLGSSATFTLEGWTPITNQAHGSTRAYCLFTKQATAQDSAATFALTRAVAKEMHAIIFAYRGADPVTPINPAPIAIRAASSISDVLNLVVLFDAQGANVHTLVLAIYYDDETDFSTVPTGGGGGFVLRFDDESAVGQGVTFALCSQDGNGNSFAPGNWASNSVNDDYYTGFVLALNKVS